MVKIYGQWLLQEEFDAFKLDFFQLRPAGNIFCSRKLSSFSGNFLRTMVIPYFKKFTTYSYKNGMSYCRHWSLAAKQFHLEPMPRLLNLHKTYEASVAAERSIFTKQKKLFLFTKHFRLSQ
jgi:hypothetical protein